MRKIQIFEYEKNFPIPDKQNVAIFNEFQTFIKIIWEHSPKKSEIENKSRAQV